MSGYPWAPRNCLVLVPAGPLFQAHRFSLHEVVHPPSAKLVPVTAATSVPLPVHLSPRAALPHIRMVSERRTRQHCCGGLSLSTGRSQGEGRVTGCLVKGRTAQGLARQPSRDGGVAGGRLGGVTSKGSGLLCWLPSGSGVALFVIVRSLSRSRSGGGKVEGDRRGSWRGTGQGRGRGSWRGAGLPRLSCTWLLCGFAARLILVLFMPSNHPKGREPPLAC